MRSIFMFCLCLGLVTGSDLYSFDRVWIWVHNLLHFWRSDATTKNVIWLWAGQGTRFWWRFCKHAQFSPCPTVFAQFDWPKLKTPPCERIAENERFSMYSVGRRITTLLCYQQFTARNNKHTRWNWPAPLPPMWFGLVFRVWFKGLVVGCQSGTANEGVGCYITWMVSSDFQMFFGGCICTTGADACRWSSRK